LSNCPTCWTGTFGAGEDSGDSGILNGANVTFRFATVKAWLLAVGLCAFPALVSAEAAVAGEAMQEDNREAYEYLRVRGVEVFFDDTSATLHAKAIIIDSQTVIAGSANLSEAALGRNTEATLLVRSRETALALLSDLGKVPRKRLAPRHVGLVRADRNSGAPARQSS
jgi:hypothetical protein